MTRHGRYFLISFPLLLIVTNGPHQNTFQGRGHRQLLRRSRPTAIRGHDGFNKMLMRQTAGFDGIEIKEGAASALETTQRSDRDRWSRGLRLLMNALLDNLIEKSVMCHAPGWPAFFKVQILDLDLARG